jgi:hypothetical protein
MRRRHHSPEQIVRKFAEERSSSVRVDRSKR